MEKRQLYFDHLFKGKVATASRKSKVLLKMVSKTDEKSVREKLDEILHQKNFVTDGLEFVEKKTGVNRLYIVLGK